MCFHLEKNLTGAPMLWASRVTYMTWTLMWERPYCYLQLVERRKHNYAALVMHLKAFNKGHLRRYNCQVTTPRKVCGLINFYLLTRGTYITDSKGYLACRTYPAICRCHKPTCFQTIKIVDPPMEHTPKLAIHFLALVACKNCDQ